jgi:hypothetical protein
MYIFARFDVLSRREWPNITTTEVPGGGISGGKKVPTVTSAANLVNICPVERFVTNTSIACTCFEFRSRSHTNSMNLILFAKVASFPTNHFP